MQTLSFSLSSPLTNPYIVCDLGASFQIPLIDQPPGPLCYLSRRIVTEPRGDGPVEGAKRGDLAAERGAGQRGYSLQSQGF